MIKVKNTPIKSEYKALLHRCGIVLPETIFLLKQYHKLQNWPQLEEDTIQHNLLNKNSTSRIKDILGFFNRNFIQNQYLPNISLLSRLISSNVSEKAKIQTLLPYVQNGDFLLKTTFLSLIYPIAKNSINNKQLTKAEISEFLAEQSNKHPELSHWSENTKNKWIRSFLSFLRDFGLMDPAPSYNIRELHVRKEVVGFFCLWLIFSDKHGIEIVNNKIWDQLLINEYDLREGLIDCHKMGWIQYSSSGDIVSISTYYKSMEEWFDDLG